MSKKTKIVSVVGGLALGLTANFGLAQGQPDFGEYIQNLAEQQGYSVSYRSADGNPPFANQDPLVLPVTDADDAAYDVALTAPQSATEVSTSDYEDIVNRMTSFIKNNVDTNGATKDNTRAIGLQSGMVLKKGTGWVPKTITNDDGTAFVWDRTINNVTWYPDYRGSVNQGFRMTTGDFLPGKMPIAIKARLDIPKKFVRESTNANNERIIWFTARVSNNNGQAPLPGVSNFFEVPGFLPYFNNPISEFFGYFNYKTGDWKLKVVVDNNVVPPSPGHVGLNLKVYSIGTAIQE